ncbi:MAG: Do family serine endopeptidase [Acidobacteria bacterium]|nr:Do family serine endopeptidase [Acidobacteriota bacterium]
MSWFQNLKQQKLLSTSLMVFTLSVGILIGTLISGNVSAAKGQAAAPDATPLTVPPAAQSANEFTKLAKQVEPSVVNISAEVRAKAASRRAPGPGDEEEEGDEMEMFRRFFRGPVPNDRNQRQRPREATGSGFVVDKNGYIVTNLHVVEKADAIKVKLSGDDKEYKAKVIGTDWESDLAVIRIDAGKPLPSLKVGNSDSVQVGDWAVAIGSPFGLAASVTAGIISATGRDLPSAEQFQRFIQTDAAINPGNSGGPLVNIHGEVIGVNTAIATQSGGYQGIGFALPSNQMVRVYNNIIQHGRVMRGSIGIGWDKYSKPEVLKAAGVNSGVLVSSVTEGGPAAKAGIKVEDVIVGINGKTIRNGDDLVAIVADSPIDSAVKVTVDRGGKKIDLNVTVQDRNEVFRDDPRWARHRDDTPQAEKAEGTPAKFGIAIRDMSAEEKGKLNLGDERGVHVTRVEEGSFAAEIGLQPRDVIISINRNPVTSPDDLRRLQNNLKPGDAVAFRVMRPIPAAAQGRSKDGAKVPEFQAFFAAGTLPEKE